MDSEEEIATINGFFFFFSHKPVTVKYLKKYLKYFKNNLKYFLLKCIKHLKS